MRRAGKDAYYYVAFGRREQDDEEFFSTAQEIIKGFEWDLKRVRGRDAALEIGCGPGRLMRPLAKQLSRDPRGRRLGRDGAARARASARHANAFPHHGTGSDLAMFADEKFDFVYSFAVFQHIPKPRRVCQLPAGGTSRTETGRCAALPIERSSAECEQYDTWNGVRITPEEISASCPRAGFTTAGAGTDLDAVHWDHVQERAGAQVTDLDRPPFAASATP